ncbi:MAG: hypothetical protein ACRCX8_16585 [Sarcina sp.]
MASPMNDLETVLDKKEKNLKKHKYTLIDDKLEIGKREKHAHNLVHKHNPNAENLDKVMLTIDKDGKNYLGEERVNLEDIVGTSRVDLAHLTWKDSLIFLQRFASFLPLEELNVGKFMEKMTSNDFAEPLKLIEHPKGSKKFYVLDGTNRIVLAKNLGMECIRAEIYSE